MTRVCAPGATKCAFYLRGAKREEQRGLRPALADPIPYVPADAGKCSIETIPRNSAVGVRGRVRRIATKRIVVRIATDSIRSGAGPWPKKKIRMNGQEREKE